MEMYCFENRSNILLDLYKLCITYMQYNRQHFVTIIISIKNTKLIYLKKRLCVKTVFNIEVQLKRKQ